MAGERIDYLDQRNFGHQALLDKFRVQLPVAVLFAAFVQWLAARLIGTDLGEDHVSNAIVTTLLANFLSMLNYRQLRLFPGARRFAFLFPAFFPVYALVALVLLWLRIPYSLSLIVIGFGTCIGVVALFITFVRSARRIPLHLIPSQKVTELLAELPNLDYRICEGPGELILPSKVTIVADLHADLSPEWERAIAAAALNGSTIYHVKQLRESLTGRVRMDHLSENSLGTLRPNEFYFFFKSAMERCAAAIGLLLAAPIIAPAAFAIRATSPGGAIFRQTRVGFRGRHFTVYKLRTMIAERGAESDRESAITKTDDPRITRLGRFLRKTRIDELPQLWNVVIGDLSLIGPRPEAVALSEWYYEQIDFYAYRHIIRPGITGWAQVNQGHVTDAEAVTAKLQYDFYYIKNYSLWLDLLIVLKTIGVVLTGRGAR